MRHVTIACLVAFLATCTACKSPKTDRGMVPGIDDGARHGADNAEAPTPGAPGSGQGNTSGTTGNNGTTATGGAPTGTGSSATTATRANGTSAVVPPSATSGSSSTSPSGSTSSTPPTPAPTPACQNRTVKSADWGKDQVDCWSKPSEGVPVIPLSNGTKQCFDLLAPRTVPAFPKPYDMYHATRLDCWVEKKHIEL